VTFINSIFIVPESLRLCRKNEDDNFRMLVVAFYQDLFDHQKKLALKR